jgi:hypothetical protein
MGQSRRFDPLRATSDLPRTTDIVRQAGLVRLVRQEETRSLVPEFEVLPRATQVSDSISRSLSSWPLAHMSICASKVRLQGGADMACADMKRRF